MGSAAKAVGNIPGKIVKQGRRTAKSVGGTAEGLAGKVFDPGKDERKRAAELQRQRINTIEGLLARFAGGGEGEFGTQELGEQALGRLQDPRSDENVVTRLAEIAEGAGSAGRSASREIASQTASRGVGLSPATAFLQNQARLGAGARGQLATSDFLRKSRRDDLATLFSLLGADTSRAGVLRGIKDPVVGSVSPFSVFKDLAGAGAGLAAAI